MPHLRPRRRRPFGLIACALTLFTTGCLDATTAPAVVVHDGPGCWLIADVGSGVSVNAHYATCPAPAGATTFDFTANGVTSHFRVRWD